MMVDNLPSNPSNTFPQSLQFSHLGTNNVPGQIYLRQKKVYCLWIQNMGSWFIAFKINIQRENVYFLKMGRSSSISRTCILLYFIAVKYKTKISMKYPEQSQHTRYLLLCLLYLTSFHEANAFVSMFLPLDSNILKPIAPTINNYIM